MSTHATSCVPSLLQSLPSLPIHTWSMLTEADILAYHARRQSGLALPPLSSGPFPGRSASSKRPATTPAQSISPVPEKRRRGSAKVSALQSGSLDAYAHVPKPRKVKKKRVRDTARGKSTPRHAMLRRSQANLSPLSAMSKRQHHEPRVVTYYHTRELHRPLEQASGGGVSHHPLFRMLHLPRTFPRRLHAIRPLLAHAFLGINQAPSLKRSCSTSTPSCATARDSSRKSRPREQATLPLLTALTSSYLSSTSMSVDMTGQWDLGLYRPSSHKLNKPPRLSM